VKRKTPRFSNVRLEIQIAELSSLNPYAVDVRYADEWREPQQAEAARSMGIAASVGASARLALPQEIL